MPVVYINITQGRRIWYSTSKNIVHQFVFQTDIHTYNKIDEEAEYKNEQINKTTNVTNKLMHSVGDSRVNFVVQTQAENDAHPSFCLGPRESHLLRCKSHFIIILLSCISHHIVNLKVVNNYSFFV